MSKKALIITDETASILLVSHLLEEELKGFTTTICSAEKFASTAEELLASDVFFIGCDEPKPASFEYLEEMLSHINLASRKCSVFSVKENTLKYLSGILKDSEARLTEPFLANGNVNKTSVKDWVKKVLK